MDFPQMESASCGEETVQESTKVCVDCKTSKTPLWRSGPAGPKSLCNACGIRYRKRNNGGSDKKKKDKQLSSPSSPSSYSTVPAVAAAAASSSAPTTSRSRESSEEGCVVGKKGMDGKLLRKTLRIKLVALGKEVVLMQRQRSPMKKKKKKKQKRNFSHHKKLGEVEQAAILLMSLSGGSVYA